MMCRKRITCHRNQQPRHFQQNLTSHEKKVHLTAFLLQQASHFGTFLHKIWLAVAEESVILVSLLILNFVFPFLSFSLLVHPFLLGTLYCLALASHIPVQWSHSTSTLILVHHPHPQLLLPHPRGPGHVNWFFININSTSISMITTPTNHQTYCCIGWWTFAPFWFEEYLFKERGSFKKRPNVRLGYFWYFVTCLIFKSSKSFFDFGSFHHSI